METLHQAFLAGGDRVGRVPMGKQMLGLLIYQYSAFPAKPLFLPGSEHKLQLFLPRH